MDEAEPSLRSKAMMRMSWSRSSSDTRTVRLPIKSRFSEKRRISYSPNVSRCAPCPDTDVSVLDGSDASLKLSEIAQGKPLVVNFWATWCPYCIDEMADYQALYEKYGDRVAFVMLNAADSASEPAAARAYVQENGFTFPVYFDAAHEGVTSYRVNGLPTTVIIAADGSLVQNAPGRIDAAKLDAQLASLL